MTELLVGTRKACSFCAARAAARSRSRRALSRARWWSSPCAIPAAAAISPASRTASSGRISSMPTTPPANGSRPKARRSPPSAGAAVERIWVIEPGVADGELWCGVAPAALFRSGDGGKSWALVQGLWDVPERPALESRRRRACASTRSAPGPAIAKRLAVSISAGGVWLTEDGGKSWRRGRQGPGAALPAGGGAPRHAHALRAQHRARAAPALDALHAVPRRRVSLRRCRRELDRHRHRRGLPSDFGFPARHRPEDPDRAFVIPLAADADRVTPDGQVRVYETRDRGASWQRARGGPAAVAGLSHRAAPGLLQRRRQARSASTSARRSGEVFGSDDGGRDLVDAGRAAAAGAVVCAAP